MSKSFRKAFIAIGIVLFLGLFTAFSSKYLSQELQNYINYLFLGFSVLLSAYFLRIWWISYNQQFDQIIDIENKVINSSDEIQNKDFGYTLQMYKTKTFQKYFLLTILIAISVSSFQIYRVVFVEKDIFAIIINIVLSVFGLIIIILYILFWKFIFLLTNTELILSYSTLFSGRKYSPIKIAKIKEHFIEYQIREDLSALLIRTNMSPLGERAFNPIIQFIFTSPLYNDPNIFIPIRSTHDANEIIKRLGF